MASRSSPSVLKAFRILELLAESPMHAFTLAEICRRLDLSYASAHALATALEEGGYVRRYTSDRRYSLGAGLLKLGSATRRAYRVVDDALPEMDRLSAELGVECHAGVAAGDEMFVVARTGPTPPHGLRVQLDERLPISPPLGAAYVAWSDEATIDAYVNRLPATATKADKERVRAGLEQVRSRGYAVSLDTATRERVAKLAESLVGEPREGGWRELESLMSDLSTEGYAPIDFVSGETYPVAAVSAPVFGPDRSVVMVMGLVRFGEALDLDRLSAYGQRLLEATSAVTERYAGWIPGH